MNCPQIAIVPLLGSIKYWSCHSASAGNGVAVDGDTSGRSKEGNDIGDFGHIDKAADRDIGGQAPLDLLGARSAGRCAGGD